MCFLLITWLPSVGSMSGNVSLIISVQLFLSAQKLIANSAPKYGPTLILSVSPSHNITVSSVPWISKIDKGLIGSHELYVHSIIHPVTDAIPLNVCDALQANK